MGRLLSAAPLEAACDIVLIRVSRFEKRNHGVSLGGAIFDGIVGKDDAMDENYSLFFLGLDTQFPRAGMGPYKDGRTGSSR